MCVIYVDTIGYIYMDGIMKVSDKANLKRSSGIGLWSGHSSLKITIQSFSWSKWMIPGDEKRNG